MAFWYSIFPALSTESCPSESAISHRQFLVRRIWTCRSVHLTQMARRFRRWILILLDSKNRTGCVCYPCRTFCHQNQQHQSHTVQEQQKKNKLAVLTVIRVIPVTSCHIGFWCIVGEFIVREIIAINIIVCKDHKKAWPQFTSFEQ